MKFLVLRADPIPWKCEVFLWEQAFNFVPAQDSETEQIGLRMGIEDMVGEVGGGSGAMARVCAHVCVCRTRKMSEPPPL